VDPVHARRRIGHPTIRAEFIANQRHVVGLTPGGGRIDLQPDAVRVPVVEPVAQREPVGEIRTRLSTSFIEDSSAG
jgi:hypothetical protein